MTIKFNRQNTDFQIAYFIAGNCHTPDAAYFALRNLENERQRAVDSLPIAHIKQEILRRRAEQKSASPDPIEQLEGQADMIAYENDLKFSKDLEAGARAELNFIRECIRRVEPLRKYSHLSDVEAAEACQAEEWGLELRRRAENYLLTSGTIPHDHFNTMRNHPDFETQLLPHIERIHQTLQLPDGATQVLKLTRSDDTIPRLLGIDSKNP
jgi:alpha-ketoglutarate-dependent taurine dioxygenase